MGGERKRIRINFIIFSTEDNRGITKIRECSIRFVEKLQHEREKENLPGYRKTKHIVNHSKSNYFLIAGFFW